MNDENTGLQAEPAKSTSYLWDIGWKHLDLHKHTHNLARALQTQADAAKEFDKATRNVERSRELIAELRAELATLEGVNG